MRDDASFPPVEAILKSIQSTLFHLAKVKLTYCKKYVRLPSIKRTFLLRPRYHFAFKG